MAPKPKQNSCFLFIYSVVFFWGEGECSQLYAECVGGGFPAVQCSRAQECSAFFSLQTPHLTARPLSWDSNYYLVSPNPPMPGVLSAGFQDQGFNLASFLPPAQLLLHCLCSTVRSCVARDAGMVLLWAQSGSLGKGRMTLSTQPLPWGHLTLLGWIRHTPVLLCPQ